ncbi:uncharacterized protein LOC144133891 [Amblyomma americanum]
MLATIDVPPSGQKATEKAAGLFWACIRHGSDDESSEVESLKGFLSKLGLDVSNMTSDPNFDIPDRITQLSLEYGFPTLVKFGYFMSPGSSKKVLDMSISKDDKERMFNQHGNNSRSNLVQAYASDLGLYDSKLEPAVLAERIVSAEVIVQQAIREIQRTALVSPWTAVGELGIFTTGKVSRDRWVGLITHYTESAFNAMDSVYLWDNATALVMLLLDDARLTRDDSRLLMAFSLLQKLLPLANGRKMNSVADSKHETVTYFCYDAVSTVMSLAVSHRYFSRGT